MTMVCCPDLMAAYQAGAIDRDGVKAVQLAMIAHCERMGDRMAIIDPLPDLSPQEVKKWREGETNYDSKYAALYYPWIKVGGPDGQTDGRAALAATWPASMRATTTSAASTRRPPTRSCAARWRRSRTITKGEQDTLNPIGVNCIRSFTGRGLRVWGARTLSSDPAWRYINVRRLFNYVEKSIETRHAVGRLRAERPRPVGAGRRDVGAFLTGVARRHALRPDAAAKRSSSNATRS